MVNEESLCFTCSKCAIIKSTALDNQYRIICPYYNKMSGGTKWDICICRVINCKGYRKKKELK